MSVTALTRDRDLIRLATAGSVDDGKSTLIGRLLLDTGSLLSDHLDDVSGNGAEFDLAAITDGLRAEREQGITIDVAYRFFSTHTRSFILADTPGHERYTRNMFTGASTADVAVVLIDARSGVFTQTRRHANIAALLGIEHMVVCVNKMDLVGWDQARFAEIVDQVYDLTRRIDILDLSVVPISALHGDNVAFRSDKTSSTSVQPCSSTWKESTSRPTAICHVCGCRSNGSAARKTAGGYTPAGSSAGHSA